jgi:uncharacterized membrane protein
MYNEIENGGGSMDDRTLTIILRLIHILAGVFWVGTAFLLAGFLVPTMRATGREGGRVIQHLMQQQRLQMFIAIAMLLTVLSGVTMYARLAAATHGTWASTRPGIAFGIGGLAAILGAFAGAMISGAAGRRLGAVGQSVGAGPPTPEQQAEMGKLQARLALGTRLAAGLLAVAAGAMAIARYL